MKILSYLATRPLEHAAKPEDVPVLISGLTSETTALEMYSEETHRTIVEHHRRRSKKDSSGRTKGGGVAK
jgi:hypothetical protein